jgi:hypothetical protein
MYMHQGLHGVFSLRLEELRTGGDKDKDKDKDKAVEESEFPRAQWSIVRAGYSHSTRGLTVAREVFFLRGTEVFFFLVRALRSPIVHVTLLVPARSFAERARARERERA